MSNIRWDNEALAETLEDGDTFPVTKQAPLVNGKKVDKKGSIAQLKALVLNRGNNLIGVQGAQDFGVGIAPSVPYTLQPMVGFDVVGHDNHGNYSAVIDGSANCYIPRFYQKITHVQITNAVGDGTNVVLTVASHNLLVGDSVFIKFATGLLCDGWSLVIAVTSTTITIANTTTGTYTANSGYIFNSVNIKGIDKYPENENALADGYVVNRMFINGGSIVNGVFVDKYDWSLTNFSNSISGIASSIKNGNPISSNSGTNRDATNNLAGSFSDCVSNSQAPIDNYGGAWSVAKSRGDDFALMSAFVAKGLALLSLAHGQASTSTTNCAWYDATNNFPKGNNNYGADVNDATCTFSACTDSYWASRNEARKTGSANTLAKTTHNGQNCGVADLNGNQYKILQGITTIASSLTIDNVTGDGTYVTLRTTVGHGLISDDWVMVTNLQASIANKMYKVVDAPTTTTIRINNAETAITDVAGTLIKGKFYSLKEAVDIKAVTGGNSLTTSDHFNDTFILANFDEIKPNFADGGGFGQRFGNNTNQVLPFSTDRTSLNYKLGCLGLPDTSGMSTGGSNQFGTDYYYQYLRDELALLSGAGWNATSIAGVWYAYLNNYRTDSYRYVSARSCLYV